MEELATRLLPSRAPGLPSATQIERLNPCFVEFRNQPHRIRDEPIGYGLRIPVHESVSLPLHYLQLLPDCAAAKLHFHCGCRADAGKGVGRERDQRPVAQPHHGACINARLYQKPLEGLGSGSTPSGLGPTGSTPVSASFC
jgi:hypothetical protein